MSDTHFQHGRARVTSTEDDAELHEIMRDGGRGAVLTGAASLSEWLVWDWTRQIDERFDALIAELYDVADQCRHLCQLVVATFLVFVIALSIVIGLVIMS